MRRSILLAAFFVPAFATFASAAYWGKDSLWNDGRAEVAVYDSEIVLDSTTTTFKEHLITFRSIPVKNSPQVFQYNEIQDFELKNYPMHFVNSLFVAADNVKKVSKMVLSVQDWTGVRTIQYNADESGKSGKYHSSLSEMDFHLSVELEEEDYFYRQLPLSLRALPFKEGYTKKIRMLKLGDTPPDATESTIPADLFVNGEELVRCHAGSIPCWIVTIKTKQGTDTYWFEKKAPNILVKMETFDGRKRLLYGRTRWKYWDKRLPRPNVLN